MAKRDAVEVVRCKDCKYWDKHCNHIDGLYLPRADQYCSFGVRKEKKMTQIQVEAVLTYAECNMNNSEASRRLYMHRNSLLYHFRQIKADTGLDPLSFYDLYKLTEIAKKERNDG